MSRKMYFLKFFGARIVKTKSYLGMSVTKCHENEAKARKSFDQLQP